MNLFDAVRRTRHLVWICLCLSIVACANRAAPVRNNAMPFEQAVNQAVDDLVVQTNRLPAFLKRIETKVKVGKIVVDPFIDAATGQQIEVSRRAEQMVMQKLQATFSQFEVLRFTPAELTTAQYVLTGTIKRQKDRNEAGQYRFALALTEIKSELVVAQSSVRISDINLDSTPTAVYRDSPAVAKDRGVEGYIRTTESPMGATADSVYLERLPTAALVSEAATAYNAEHYASALQYYEAAAKRPDGQQLRILNGVYSSLVKLQRMDDAERAFGAIVRLGLATNSLSLRFLFKPGSTDFIADPKISGSYTMWLRQIARQIAQSSACVAVTGHTSRTGSEQANDRLSLLRAATVRKRLEAESPVLAGRLEEVGKGFRENIIGTGTDDARDAPDRRVEFLVVECKSR